MSACVCSSADVGQDDGLDGLPAHGAELVALLELRGAGVAGHEVSGASVDDAAVLGSALAYDTGLQTGRGQARLGAARAGGALKLGRFLLAGGGGGLRVAQG